MNKKIVIALLFIAGVFALRAATVNDVQTVDGAQRQKLQDAINQAAGSGGGGGGGGGVSSNSSGVFTNLTVVASGTFTNNGLTVTSNLTALGTVNFTLNGSDALQFRASGASAVIEGTGGFQSDISYRIDGTQTFARSNGTVEFQVLQGGATDVNYISVTSALTGNPAIISSQGDVNTGISILPKGTGSITFGTIGQTNGAVFNSTITGDASLLTNGSAGMFIGGTTNFVLSQNGAGLPASFKTAPVGAQTNVANVWTANQIWAGATNAFNIFVGSSNLFVGGQTAPASSTPTIFQVEFNTAAQTTPVAAFRNDRVNGGANLTQQPVIVWNRRNSVTAAGRLCVDQLDQATIDGNGAPLVFTLSSAVYYSLGWTNNSGDGTNYMWKPLNTITAVRYAQPSITVNVNFTNGSFKSHYAIPVLMNPSATVDAQAQFWVLGAGYTDVLDTVSVQFGAGATVTTNTFKGILGGGEVGLITNIGAAGTVTVGTTNVIVRGL